MALLSLFDADTDGHMSASELHTLKWMLSRLHEGDEVRHTCLSTPPPVPPSTAAPAFLRTELSASVPHRDLHVRGGRGQFHVPGDEHGHKFEPLDAASFADRCAESHHKLPSSHPATRTCVRACVPASHCVSLPARLAGGGGGCGRFQHAINGTSDAVFEILDADKDAVISKEELIELRKHLGDDALHLVRSAAHHTKAQRSPRPRMAPLCCIGLHRLAVELTDRRMLCDPPQPEHPAISRAQARQTLPTSAHDRSFVERMFDLLDENGDRALDATERKHVQWYARELRQLQ